VATLTNTTTHGWLENIKRDARPKQVERHRRANVEMGRVVQDVLTDHPGRDGQVHEHHQQVQTDDTACHGDGLQDEAAPRAALHH
jgi:hypothetical protein